MFNRDLTIINKWYNKQTRSDEYKVNYIKGFFSSNESINIGSVDLVKSSGFISRILKSESGYQKPKDFQLNPTGWTLQNDDYIVNGTVTEKFNSISEVYDNYECMKITNISDKNYGSLEMRHFEISGS